MQVSLSVLSDKLRMNRGRKMKEIKNAALITAIKTPFLENGKIDLETYDRLVERQIAGGAQGLIIGGTTGEGHLMDWEEHILLIAHTVNKFSDKLVLIGNTGSNNTREAYKATEQGFAVGMDAALLINPYYGKASESGVIAHFEKPLDLGPAIIYNVPGRTGQDLQPHIIERLAKHENMVGVKECAGMERIKGYEEQGIACWSGNDDEAHDTRHQCGSHGVISVVSNVLPRTTRKLMDQEDSELNKKLLPFINWLFHEPNPIPLNNIMMMLGLVSPVFRLPYTPLTKELRKKGKQILEELASNEVTEDISTLEDNNFILI